jgi:hypothetical protein
VFTFLEAAGSPVHPLSQHRIRDISGPRLQRHQPGRQSVLGNLMPYNAPAVTGDGSRRGVRQREPAMAAEREGFHDGNDFFGVAAETRPPIRSSARINGAGMRCGDSAVRQ